MGPAARGNPMDPEAVLIPFSTSILPPCERALEELERRVYDVRRVGGFAAIAGVERDRFDTFILNMGPEPKPERGATGEA